MSNRPGFFKSSDGMEFPFPDRFINKPLLTETDHSKLYLVQYYNAHGVARDCVAKVSKGNFSENEFFLIDKLDNENILTPLAMCRDKKTMVIYMPYCKNGTLLSATKSPIPPTERICKFMFRQMVGAVQYLHCNNIIHNDVKLENFLVDGATVKLSDFGLSYEVLGSELDLDKVGTPLYMAPEVLADAGHTYSADVWSLGIALYHLFHGDVPFDADNIRDLRAYVFHSKRSKQRRICSDELDDLIKKILRVDPAERLTTSQILEHPWFTTSTVMSARRNLDDIHTREFKYRRCKSA